MKNKIFIWLILMGLSVTAQVKVGNNPTTISSSSLLELESTTKGFRLPQMTSTQRTAIVDPTAGLQVFDTTTNTVWGYNGTAWNNSGATTASNGLTAASGNVKLGGAITEPTTISALTAINKLEITGTGVDAINLDSNTLSVDATNNRLGVGTAAPTHKLHVASVDNDGIRIGNVGTTGTTTVPLGAETAKFNLDFTGYRDSELDQIGARISALRFNNYLANNALIQTTGLAFYTNPSGMNSADTDLVERMRIMPSGNIGIGTAAPAVKLDLHGSTITNAVATEEVLRLNRPVLPSTKNAVSAGIKIGSFETGVNGRGRMDFVVSGTPTLNGNAFGAVPDVNVMTLQGDGNVGIGTETPAAKLDVNGTIKISGGTPGAGKVLTSDATGLATWEVASGVPNWQFADTFTAVGITATVTAPTFNAVGYNSVYIKQIGPKTYMVNWSIQMLAGTSGNGDYLIKLPNNLSFDTSIHTQSVYTGSNGDTIKSYTLSNSFGCLMRDNNVSMSAYVVPYSPTYYRVFLERSGIAYGPWSSIGFPIGSGYIYAKCEFTFQSM